MTPTRTTSALLTIAVVASTAVLLFRGGSSTAQRGLSPTDVSAAERDRETRGATGLDARGTSGDSARVPLRAAQAEADPATLGWAGAVRVGDDAEHLEQFEGDGMMTLERGPGATSVLPVLDGRWDAGTLGSDPVEVRELWLSSRCAEALEPVALASNGGATLEAVWATELEFTVTSSGGIPLRGIDVMRQTSAPGRLRLVPWLDADADAEPLVTGTASPVRVPLQAESSASLWFTAAGHGWSSWQPGPGGRAIELPVESRLSVRVETDESEAEGWSVSLYAALGYPSAPALIRSAFDERSAIQFDKLPAGEFVVALERTGNPDRTLCVERVTLAAGRLGTAVLTPSADSARMDSTELAELRGVVTSTEPGQVARLRIHPWSRGALASGQEIVDVEDSLIPCQDSDLACVEWGPTRLVPGTYLVQALPSNASWVIDVAPGLNIDDHHVQRARSVRFEFRDARTGAPVEASRVTLTQLGGVAVDAHRFPKATSLSQHPSAASMVAEVFPGTLGLTVDAAGYGVSYLTLQPESWAATQVVELSGKAELELRYKGHSPHLTQEWLRQACVVEAASGQRVAHEVLGIGASVGSESTTKARLCVATGGDYVVHLPAMDSPDRYVPAPIRVALEPGQRTTLSIDDAPWSGFVQRQTTLSLRR